MAKFDTDPQASALCHLLMDTGKAEISQLETIYEESQSTGKPFRDVFLNYGILDERQLLELIAKSFDTEVIKLGDYEIPHEMVDLLTPSTARLYGVIPFKMQDGMLCFVAKDPFDYRVGDDLSYMLNIECRMFVAKPSDIDKVMNVLYPDLDEKMDDVLGEISDISEAVSDTGSIDLAKIEEMSASAPIKKFVNMVLYHGIRSRASDIHLEPFADQFRIRYRVDGTLYEMAPPPKHLALSIISRVKVMSNLNIAERRIPQDGRIELQVAGKPVDLRVSTLPTQYGESVVMRILDRGVVNLQLEALGMNDQVMKDVRQFINRPNGIMVVTGPTGSGKTTTLYSCLSEINTIEDKLLTAEDPVEYNIDGIMQVPINDAVGMTFAAALRSFLRQDPDRIMVGEIRDLETAQMAVQAALTGHLVLSTLHTNDAAGAVTRFIDMGVEPFLISSSLIGALGQRLLRRICSKCRTEYRASDAELMRLSLTREEINDRPFFYGKGCETCNSSGYKGRVGLYELLRVSPAIQIMINTRQPTAIIRARAVEEGMVTMRQNGLRCVLDGVTTVEEVLKYT
jgi:type IV pilus assembly protein PilB